MEDTLKDIGLKAIGYTETLDLQEAEVYLESTASISIAVEGGKIKTVAKKNDMGCGIRAVSNKRIGYSYSTSVTLADIKDTIVSALHLAKIASPDEDYIGLTSGDMQYQNIKGIHDSRVASLSLDDSIDLIQRAIGAIHEKLGEKATPVVAGMFEAKEITRVILNSNGILCSGKSTLLGLDLDAAIDVNGSHGSSWHSEYTTSLASIIPEKLGAIVGQKVLNTLNPKKMESGKMQVVLSPDTVSTFFNGFHGRGLVAALSAAEVEKKNSYLLDRIGCEISSSSLTLIDNGCLAGGISSRVFDAEGYPSQYTPLIKDGILQSYLHDSYTAQKTGLESTGNSSRKSYSESPKIAASNFILEEGKGSEEELIEEIKYGLFCRFTGDTPDPLSGDLNAVVMEGQVIKDGDLSHPVSNTMFSINILDLLKGITRIGGNPTITARGIFPTIRIDGAIVSSG